MKFKAEEWDFLYTKDGEQGTCDLLIYNPITKELFFEEDIEQEYVNGVDSYGNPYFGAELSRRTFNIIFNKLFRADGCSAGFFDDWGAAETYRRDKSKEIPKETIFKAIRGELSKPELDGVVQRNPEHADYYDFDAFVSVIHRFLRGEISREYYRCWTIVVCWALQNNPFKQNSKKQLLYGRLSDCFDGHAFDALEADREKECYEMIAWLKYYDHLLKNTRKSVEPPFYNDNGVAVYVCFDACNHHNSHYKLCVADEEKRIFKITSIANPYYLEHVNYTFLDRDEFDDLSGTYYEFYHDRTIDVHKYITELPYLDVNGAPIPMLSQ